MNDATLMTPVVRSEEVRAPAYIGPLIPQRLWPLRYIAAIGVVAATVGIRAALAPLLGTQAPLLPFVLAVFVSAYLGGRGPGLLASLLTPVAATLWFATWPHEHAPLQWAAHVVFFLLISALATVLIHELQRSSLAQLVAMRGAAQSEVEARKRAEQLSLIADAMPALISYIAPDGTYRFTNKLYETWFGKPASQVVGRHVREVLGEAAFEMVRPRLERAMKGTRVFFEQQIPYASGARDVAVHYIPDVDPQGKVRGCFALIEDISARKRAEHALREADRRKDDFLAILGHELRNPLTPIRNVAHILGRGPVDAATVRRSGELLERQAGHLTRLVDDLLDVGLIVRGRVTLQRERLRFAAVVDTAIDSIRPMLESRHQTVTVSCDDPSLSIDADAVRICQVVVNLLSNAIKYSPEGARIEIRIKPLAGEAMLSVLDRGAGIDPQMLPLIFEQFLQGDRSLDRLEGGLGIGLTVVRRMVEMHGGRVEALSEGLGRGSEFRVYLPRVEAAPQILARAPGGASTLGARRRVLVVDDNTDAAESLRELLRLEGHEVAVVRDGAQALDKLYDFRADVVLLDLALPRMDGFMVAHAIRARFFHVYPRPRLLALSGFARDEDRQSALRSGFDGYLCKPVEPELMLRVIAGDNHWHTSANEIG